jgi:hypothetical protein
MDWLIFVFSYIYITGLGDDAGSRNVAWQKKILRLWRLGGVKTTLFRMGWGENESFEKKLERLLEVIDKLDERGHKISLLGVSAGASAAVAAFVLRSRTISGVVFICGKLARPEAVQKSYFIENPAFYTSMQQLEVNLAKLKPVDKHKMLSIRPLYDQTVAVRDTKIAGVHSKLIPTLFHTPSIALGITIFSLVVVSFLKKQAKIGL